MQFITTLRKSGTVAVNKEIRKAYHINEDDQLILELIKVIRKKEDLGDF